MSTIYNSDTLRAAEETILAFFDNHPEAGPVPRKEHRAALAQQVLWAVNRANARAADAAKQADLSAGSEVHAQ